MITAIVAHDLNRLIGGGNDLLWHLPDDLKHFKAKTLGKPIIMGRRTFDSVGRALPKRSNIVITRKTDWSADKVTVVSSLEAAIATAQSIDQDVWIVGGGEIYRLALPYCHALEITVIDAAYQGDTWFPSYDEGFVEVSRAHHPADDHHAVAFDFIRLERRD